MGNIFNQIKKRLTQISEAPVTDEHWNSFVSYRSEKLNENKKRSIGWPIFALLGLLLLSLGANGFLLSNRNQVSQLTANKASLQTDTIYIMQPAMASSQPTNFESKLDSSLSVLRAMIKQQEKSILAHQKAERRLSSDNLSKELHPFNSLSDLLSRYPAVYNIIREDILLGNQSVFRESLATISLHQGRQTQEGMIIRSAVVANNLSSLVDPIDYLSIRPFLVDNNLSKYRSSRHILLPAKKKTFLEAIRPKTFSVGIFGGMNSPANYRYSNQIGSFYGATISTMFSSKVRGNLMFGSHRVNGKSDDMGLGTGVPEIVLLENQVLEYVKIQQSSYMTSVGLDYIFSGGKHFRPYAGLSYGLAFNSVNKYNYELLSLQGEFYEKRQIKSDVIDQFGLMTAGLDFRLSQQVNAHLAIDYLFFNNTPADVPNRFRIRPSILYHF